MMIRNQLELGCVKMLLLVSKFSGKKDEVRSLKRLYLFTLLMDYPKIVNGVLEKLGQEKIIIKDYHQENVELEVIMEQKFLEVDVLTTQLAILISKGLVKVELNDGDKIVKITEEGKSIVNRLDPLEWSEYDELAQIIKRHISPILISRLEEVSAKYMPRLFVSE